MLAKVSALDVLKAGLSSAFIEFRRAVSALGFRAKRFRIYKLAFFPWHVVVTAAAGKNPRPVTQITAEEAAGSLIGSTSGRPYSRTLPTIVGAPEPLFTKLKARLKDEIDPPAARVAVLTHVTISSGGVILTANDEVVSESLINTQLWDSFGIFQRNEHDGTLSARLPKIVSVWRRHRRCPHVMIKQSWDGNYGHWLVEGLPRVALIAEHFDLAKCRFIVSDEGSPMRQVYEDSLALFGIDRDQLVRVKWEPVHIDELIYPLPLTIHPWVKSPLVVEVLEKLARRLTYDGSGLTHMYVSRNHAQKRRLLNEDAILPILRQHGFVVVYPEDLSLYEQMRLFHSAEVIIGNCGAGLTNLVFAPRGMIVFALTSQFMQDDFFWDLTSLKSGHYISLHGSAIEPDLGMESDFQIDIEQFECLFNAFIKGQPADCQQLAAADPFGREDFSLSAKIK